MHNTNGRACHLAVDSPGIGHVCHMSLNGEAERLATLYSFDDGYVPAMPMIAVDESPIQMCFLPMFLCCSSGSAVTISSHK